MKNSCLILFIALLANSMANSQPGRTIRVRSGEDIALAYSGSGFYRFPQFTPAILYFKTGKNNSGLRFNYNLLSGYLHFIGPRGDTLEVAGQAQLDSVVFGHTVFYYREGIAEEIAKVDSVKLLKKTLLRLEFENIGAYGLANTTSAVVSLKYYSTGTAVYRLTLNHDVVLREEISWYWMDQRNNLFKASKANLFLLLSPEKKAIAEEYNKMKKVRYDRETDLKALLAELSK